MSIFKSISKLFGASSLCPRWDAALADCSFFEVAAALGKTLPEAKNIVFYTPNDSRYEALRHDPSGFLLTNDSVFGRTLAAQKETAYAILASDEFFNGPMATSLQAQGWADKSIAQLVLLHELGHGCVAQAAFKNNDLQHEKTSSIKLWKSAFYAWPISQSLRAPTLSIAATCAILKDFSPHAAARFSYIPMATEFNHEVNWAGNLEELRADGLAIAVCAASKNSIFDDHPLHVDFFKALNQIHVARNNGQHANAYRWGAFKDAMAHAGSDAVQATSTAIAIAECAALASANNNLPYLASLPEAHPAVLREIQAYFPNPQSIANQQFQECLSLLQAAFPLAQASPNSKTNPVAVGKGKAPLA